MSIAVASRRTAGQPHRVRRWAVPRGRLQPSSPGSASTFGSGTPARGRAGLSLGARGPRAVPAWSPRRSAERERAHLIQTRVRAPTTPACRPPPHTLRRHASQNDVASPRPPPPHGPKRRRSPPPGRQREEQPRARSSSRVFPSRAPRYTTMPPARVAQLRASHRRTCRLGTKLPKLSTVTKAPRSASTLERHHALPSAQDAGRRRSGCRKRRAARTAGAARATCTRRVGSRCPTTSLPVR